MKTICFLLTKETMSKGKKKSERELYAEGLFSQILAVMFKHLGTGLTDGQQLNDVGSRLFGSRFAGVYPKDHIPRLTRETPTCIVNTDPLALPGEHWMAMCLDLRNPAKQKIHIFDTFRRKHTTLIESKYLDENNEYKGVDLQDKIFKQPKKANFCGQASLSFIQIWLEKGPEVALLI